MKNIYIYIYKYKYIYIYMYIYIYIYIFPRIGASFYAVFGSHLRCAAVGSYIAVLLLKYTDPLQL